MGLSRSSGGRGWQASGSLASDEVLRSLRSSASSRILCLPVLSVSRSLSLAPGPPPQPLSPRSLLHHLDLPKMRTAFLASLLALASFVAAAPVTVVEETAVDVAAAVEPSADLAFEDSTGPSRPGSSRASRLAVAHHSRARRGRPRPRQARQQVLQGVAVQELDPQGCSAHLLEQEVRVECVALARSLLPLVGSVALTALISYRVQQRLHQVGQPVQQEQELVLVLCLEQEGRQPLDLQLLLWQGYLVHCASPVLL